VSPHPGGDGWTAQPRASFARTDRFFGEKWFQHLRTREGHVRWPEEPVSLRAGS
jgi:hypothetical protein